MARLFLLLTGLLLLGGGGDRAWAGASKPKGQVRVHLQVNQQPGPSAHATIVTLTNPDETIAISSLPEVSERELESIELLKGGEGAAILKFDQRGKLLLNNMTNQGQGRIMVVYLNGRMIYTPVIDSQIVNGVLVIPRGVTAKDIEVLTSVTRVKNNR